MLAAKLAQAENTLHFVQSFSGAAAFKAKSGDGVVRILTHNVPPANFERINIQAACDLVHRALDRETCRYPPDAAVRPHRSLIGSDGIDVPLVSRNIVGPWHI